VRVGTTAVFVFVDRRKAVIVDLKTTVFVLVIRARRQRLRVWERRGQHLDDTVIA
jgi:hypothetical protein